MTKRQADLLAFIKSYIAEHGFSPSYDEMRLGIGLKSKSGIHRLIASLAEKNEIHCLPYRARAIKVLSPVDRAIRDVAQEKEIDMAALEERWDATMERYFG